MSTPTSALRLLVHADRPTAPERGAIFLVGGYDGSGNYGDMVLLQAALALLARAAPRATPIPVLELEYRDSHAELAARSPVLDSVPVAFFDGGLSPTPDGMRRLELPGELAFGGVYLYGGGYLNAWWGARKLAMARAAEAAVHAAGIPRLHPLVSGVQADPAWLAGLAGRERDMVHRLVALGVRDEASLPSRNGGPPALLTGDDAVGVLAPFAGAAAPEEGLRVNVHLQDQDWVTADRDGHLAFLAGLLERLGDDATIQPVIAYEDRRITERPLAERLATEPAFAGRVAGDPVVLRPGGLGDALAVLGRAQLTICCSYHVALTSDLLGVPAALVAGTPYYEQKAAGLNADFGLPAAFTLRPSAPVDVAAAALADALAHPDELRAALARGAERAIARRRDAEDALAAALADAIEAAAPDPDAALEDHAEESGFAERIRAELAARDARLSERDAAFDRLWLELVEYKETQVRLNARIYELETTLDAERREAARLQHSHHAIVSSRTWRFTEPLRRAPKGRRAQS